MIQIEMVLTLPFFVAARQSREASLSHYRHGSLREIQLFRAIKSDIVGFGMQNWFFHGFAANA